MTRPDALSSQPPAGAAAPGGASAPGSSRAQEGAQVSRPSEPRDPADPGDPAGSSGLADASAPHGAPAGGGAAAPAGAPGASGQPRAVDAPAPARTAPGAGGGTARPSAAAAAEAAAARGGHGTAAAPPGTRPSGPGASRDGGGASATTGTGAPGPLPGALSFALPLALLLASVPAAALLGGWALLLPPAMAWWAVGAADALFGRDTANADPNLPEAALRRHRALTLAWPPVQLLLVFGTLTWVTAGTGPAHLSQAEQLALFFGVGVFTGTIGITYAHEMMHQRPGVERALADLLLASVLYGHFRSEHLLVHHRHVATPRDTVTARYGESFYHFFPRVLAGSLRSALQAEAARLRAAGRSPWHRRNPFWRYAALQAGFLAAALALGGAWGLALFAVQAATAIWVLELTNYVEHYGLTRRHLGGGRYEPAGPHHSWNSDHAASNRLLINLQRHSDHHVKPARRFPLLQTYAREEAPQLPLGYPLIAGAAMVPPLWRRIMHPRLKAWRRRHYPDIADWSRQGGGGAPGTS